MTDREDAAKVMTEANRISPIEALARVIFAAAGEHLTIDGARSIAAEGLLALAECELPEEVRVTGCAQLVLSDELRADLWDDMGDAFEAMLRSLASEGE